MKSNYVTVTPTQVGICGSDLQKIAGGAALETLGHEIVGTAIIDGKRQRVAVNPLISCGHCGFCQTDRSMFCTSLAVIGRDTPGALAGPLQVPRANIVLLPADMSDSVAVLADPYAVVVHGMSLLAALKDAADVMIIGDGVIGLLNLLYFFLHGSAAATYTVVSRKKARLSQLQIWLEAWAPGEFAERVRFVTGLTPGQSFDLAVEAVGRDQIDTFTMAIEALTPRGRLLSYGVYPPGSLMNVDMRTVMYKEVTVVGVNSYNPGDFGQAVNELGAYQSLFTHLTGGVYPWIERHAAGEAARDKSTGSSKKISIRLSTPCV